MFAILVFMANEVPGFHHEPSDYEWHDDLPSTRFRIMRDIYREDPYQQKPPKHRALPPLGPQSLALLEGRREQYDHNLHKEPFRKVLYQMAIRYASYIGVDYTHETLLADCYEESWWRPEYIKSDDGGEMMSEMDALRCLVDIERTGAFVRAIEETVRRLQQRTDKPLTAIDAGAGSGILSIALAAYGVEKTVAIELNPKTVRAARLLAADLGLSDKIIFLEGDATTIDLPFDDVDIFVSETLSSGLTDEPHGQILDHLSRYLAPDAQIIPYAATLEMSFSESDWSAVDESIKMYRASELPSKTPIHTPVVKKYFTPDTALSTIKGHTMVRRDVEHNLPIYKLMNIQMDTSAYNTLRLGTCFLLNKEGNIYTLSGEKSKFLGRTTAFKLEGLDPYAEYYEVFLEYEPGCKKRDLKVHVVDGNTVIITDRDVDATL